MKVKKQTFVLLLTVLIGIPTISAQSKQERDKTMEKVVRKIITSKDYKLKVDTYMVAQESPTSVNFCSTIEIKNDSIFSNLLYPGQNYIPYSNRGGELYFQAPIEKYALDIDKKGNTRIKIATRTLVNKIDFKIIVYPNGSTYINVNIQHCQSVIYLGKLEAKNSSFD